MNKKLALLSVSDKTGIVEFARGLVETGYTVVSTGGTKDVLDRAGVPVSSITEITGFPEIMDGRVKTLHPKIHGGILAKRDQPSHREEMRKHAIPPIDLVAVNLYPFARTVEKPDVTLKKPLKH